MPPRSARPVLTVSLTLALALLAGCTLGGKVSPGSAALAGPEVPGGAADFAVYCTACHGTTGKGDGPLAATLPARPADLTRLAADNGGTFPTARVMSKIWGYTDDAAPTAEMPAFGELLDGPTVLYDSGDGISTPTPARLVDLAEYVEGVQAK